MNHAEFNQIVDDYSDALYRFALKNIKVSEDAQEIVQTSFERLWSNRNKVEFSKMKAYLFKIAYNLSIDLIRKRKNESDIDELNDPMIAEYPTYHSDLKTTLNNALETLNEKQKNAILLRDYEGYSYKEIGDILGLSENQVKINIFRGRKHLQEILVSIDRHI